MAFKPVIVGIAILAVCGSALADVEKYSIHENVHVGQRIAGDLVCQGHTKRITTENGKSTTDENEYKQILKTTFTVLAVKDGSAVEIKVEVDPESYDIDKTPGQTETKTASSYAGKTVTIRRRADETIASDFTEVADSTDSENLNSLLNPDEDFFPDQPVAVGETWDISAKLSKHAELGPSDQLMAQCKLDWVKEIDGKKMAQITCSEGTILQEEGNVEEDVQCMTTCLVDLAANQIVKCDQKGSSKISTPAGESKQTTGSSEFTYVGRAFGAAATQP